MSITHYPPKYRSKSFHCPHCQVYAKQTWYRTLLEGELLLNELEVSLCAHCNMKAFWFNKVLIVPNSSLIAPPHIDMPESIKPDYTEAYG